MQSAKITKGFLYWIRMTEGVERVGKVLYKPYEGKVKVDVDGLEGTVSVRDVMRELSPYEAGQFRVTEGREPQADSSRDRGRREVTPIVTFAPRGGPMEGSHPHLFPPLEPAEASPEHKGARFFVQPGHDGTVTLTVEGVPHTLTPDLARMVAGSLIRTAGLMDGKRVHP